MKALHLSTAISAVLVTSATINAAPVLVPNGDFSTPNGAEWTEVSGVGTFAFSYPGSGGNPGGHGVIDHTANDGGWAIWVANGDAEIPLASLGLTDGETYVFTQDMTILSGDNIGGFKVDFFIGGELSGSTNDIYNDLIGTGTTWETYTFPVTIPAGTEGIKVVPLWGPGSSIGYDNVGVDNTPIETPLIPNGNFENGNASWFEQGAPNTSFSYPPTGGNPDGYGVMANDGAGSGNWVANGGAPLSLDSLGLAGGNTVFFAQDMRIETGSVGANIGGLRIDFLAGPAFLGDTGNMIPDLIGDGSTWETYVFEVEIPATADHIKIVPLRGAGSTVGYDNVTFIPAPPEAFAADIALGTTVSWSPTSETNVYQPQWSLNETEWMDLGEPLTGTAVNAVCDTVGASFYRVLETPLGSSNIAINGGFETPDPGDSMLADAWTPIGSQSPVRITSDFRTGSAAMQIMVQNDDGGSPHNSEIQQGVPGIIPGESYDFSFWAKQVSSGVSYVQQYRIQWLDDGGAIVSEAFGFTPFAGGSGEWTETSNPGLVAPAGASTALIQIFGATGAVPGASAQGEVLIDDLSLQGLSSNPSVVESVVNGDFELLDLIDPNCAESWICGGTQSPLNIISDSLSGIASMQLRVENDGSATPNSSVIQHDIAAAGSQVTPGVVYDFSFWAKQVSSGVSYIQQYRLEWRDQFGAPLSGGIAFTAFAGGDGDWLETSVPGILAPANAATAFIELIASTGAVAGSSAEGEVLIDDVSLSESAQPVVLPATVGPGLKISWPTETGKDYQVEYSNDLGGFADFGPPVSGDGSRASVSDQLTGTARYYRVIESTP